MQWGVVGAYHNYGKYQMVNKHTFWCCGVTKITDFGTMGCPNCYCVCSGFYQCYQWYTNIVQGSTNGTIGKIIGTKGNANGTTDSSKATNGIIGKITNGTIGKPRTESLSI